MSISAGSSEQALHILPHLLRLAQSTRRPVFLQLPIDVLFGRPKGTIACSYRAGHTAPFDRAAAERALASMRRAKKIALLVGSGARNVEPAALVGLAEGLGAGVATTPKGKSLFPEDHPLSLGVFGFASSGWAEAALLGGELEVLVALGSSLGELATNGWSPRLRPAELIHVDASQSAFGATYPSLPVVGDAATVVGHWRSALELAPIPRAKTRWLQAIKQSRSRFAEPAAMTATDVPLRPERVMAEIQGCLPSNALVISDIGNCMAYALQYLTLSAQQRFVINLGFACMGHAPATALGAHFADPSRPIIALMGDAAFAMGGFEVHTAVEYRAAHADSGGPVIVVLNNGGNGMVEAGVRAEFGGGHGIDTGMYRRPVDIAQLARALGAAAQQVRAPGELSGALCAALEPGRGPSVLDVRIASDVAPPMGARIATLADFAERLA